MPVGWDGVVIVWAALLLPFVLPPAIVVLFYWRRPHPKLLTIVLSSLILYLVLWAAVELGAAVLGDDAIYGPLTVALVLGWLALLLARNLCRRVGVLPDAP